MYYYPQQQQVNAAMLGYMPPMTQPSALRGRPVSSLEEARASQIDFDGSLFIFPDVANKKIYTKQINLDGTATLNTYSLDVGSLTALPQNYVSKEEFEALVKEVEALKQPITEVKEGKQNGTAIAIF
jgi:hypothetical protein